MNKDYVTYPAILSYDVPGEVGITFPDFCGCTGQCSEDSNISSYALETLCFHLSGMIEDDEDIPEPSRIQDISLEDEQAVMPVRVYLPALRERLYNKAVNRTVTLPYWLDKEAKNEGINFSQTLQNAIMEKLGVMR